MGMEIGGLLGLIVIIADILAILNVVQSDRSTGNKVVWILLIIVLPVIGLLFWLIIGPRTAVRA